NLPKQASLLVSLRRSSCGDAPPSGSTPPKGLGSRCERDGLHVVDEVKHRLLDDDKTKFIKDFQTLPIGAGDIDLQLSDTVLLKRVLGNKLDRLPAVSGSSGKL